MSTHATENHEAPQVTLFATADTKAEEETWAAAVNGRLTQ